MPVDDEIEEVQFFLEKIEETNPLRKEFLFYLSAFLAAARSTLDYHLRLCRKV